MVTEPARRAVGAGAQLADGGQGAAPAAERAPATVRRGAGAAALPRHDRAARGARDGTGQGEVLRALRQTLHEQGYVEVETPVLQLTNGGAAARPFRTHLNAFDQEMLLRIALELDLKRAMVGGVERVYEIGKTFRNEGIDSTHAAEFMMLEAYQAYGDYESMMELVRDLVLAAARAVGRTVVPARDGSEIDLEAPWRRASLLDLVSAAVGDEVDRRHRRRHAAPPRGAHEVALQPGVGAGRGRCRAVRAAGRGHPDPADVRRATIPRRSGRWPSRTARCPGSTRHSTSSSTVSSWSPPTPSSTTRWCSASVCSSRQRLRSRGRSGGQ